MSGELLQLDTATRLLAEARTVDEIKHVRDIAEAARLRSRWRLPTRAP